MFDDKFIFVLLANIVLVIHLMLYVILLPLGVCLANLKKQKFLVYWSGIVWLGTFPSQWFFRRDCPLRILEYCLRYLGGEKVAPDRLHAVAYMKTLGIPETQIYSQLLRQAGIFLLIGFALVTASAFFLSKQKPKLHK